MIGTKTRAWNDPVPGSERDAASWTAWCATVIDQIKRVRMEDGIDSRLRQSWQTFDPPLVAVSVPIPLPIGRVPAHGELVGIAALWKKRTGHSWQQPRGCERAVCARSYVPSGQTQRYCSSRCAGLARKAS